MPVNIEIKARCPDHTPIRRALEAMDARCVGTDQQKDTYFKAKAGRLKLREGPIENALIHYDRPDSEGPKRSDVTLAKLSPDSGLGDVLRSGLETVVVVEKTREIWFADNVKIHLDDVSGLGRSVEIEAIDTDGSLGESHLRRQCDFFLELFGIAEEDLLASSYSDMLLKEQH